MCKCCEDIQFIKELNKTDNPNIKRKLKATITSISKRKGQKGIAGRVGYGSYDLNYCPMCRKEVNIVDKKKRKFKIIEKIILLLLYIPLMIISFYYFPCIPITMFLMLFGIYILIKFNDKEE